MGMLKLLAVIYIVLPAIFGLISRHRRRLSDLLSSIGTHPFKATTIIVFASLSLVGIFTDLIGSFYLNLVGIINSNIDFVKPDNDYYSSIFGFSEFISSLAILFILYTVTGVRYKFRIAVAPIPLFGITYFSVSFIGVGALLMDFWFTEGWLIPQIISDPAIWQGLFGLGFFLLVMLWVFFAYIRPPKFSKYNYKKYSNELYRVILEGGDDELRIVSHEVARSMKAFVSYADEFMRDKKARSDNKSEKTQEVLIGGYANDMLLLIGNRKFCRYVMSSSPITAITLFDTMSTSKIYDLPIGQFATNITVEAIHNKDSIIYHEDDGYEAGLIGYIKPFSSSVYGDFRLLEKLGSSSPFDVRFSIGNSFDSIELAAYCRLVLITLDNYLETSGGWLTHTFVLPRALDLIQHATMDFYKLNDDLSNCHEADEYKRLKVVVGFAEYAVKKINAMEAPPKSSLKTTKKYYHKNIYDNIAELMFEVIFHVSGIKDKSFSVWDIQHNLVWNKFFNTFEKGKAWDIVQFKLRRLLYNEIIELSKFPNYKSAKILGYCLYVMGIKDNGKSNSNSSYYALKKVVLKWTRNNFLKFRADYCEVSDASLVGHLRFDEKKSSIVKSYMPRMDSTIPEDCLYLLEPEN